MNYLQYLIAMLTTTYLTALLLITTLLLGHLQLEMKNMVANERCMIYQIVLHTC